jgi:asparagine synthetase B (glutamine-hydrolysing)
MADAVEAMQSPSDAGSLLPQYALGAAVKEKGYHVTLSGDGADELFGGYRRAKEYDSQSSDVFVELPYWHLPRLDRVMMKHTVEHRTPFLAPEIVKYALGLSWSRRTEKEELKRIARGIVPQGVIDQPKKPLKSAGFNQNHRINLSNVWRSAL